MTKENIVSQNNTQGVLTDSRIIAIAYIIENRKVNQN